MPEHPNDEREARRAAMARLATSLRRMTDVAVCTNLPAHEVEDLPAELDRLTAVLAREQHDGPFSGLLPKQRDPRRPHYSMPLSPIIGELNPIRPEVTVELRGDRVFGTAVLGKKFVGPAGFAHGGVTAMICDQLVALASRAAGIRGVTASMEVRFRRPTPLYEELELEAWCEDAEESEAQAFAEIRARGDVAVRAQARVVVAAFAHPEERRIAPPASVSGPHKRA